MSKERQVCEYGFLKSDNKKLRLEQPFEESQLMSFTSTFYKLRLHLQQHIYESDAT